MQQVTTAQCNLLDQSPPACTSAKRNILAILWRAYTWWDQGLSAGLPRAHVIRKHESPLPHNIDHHHHRSAMVIAAVIRTTPGQLEGHLILHATMNRHRSSDGAEQHGDVTPSATIQGPSCISTEAIED
ncbi:MAG: hypothetical protein HETSPECPRED_002749 [Heterodermia speciosa]|uniref:Uncharacterized protein n=1 Tax=Heterodermia speciosa TaxID=116794 RepID=A0A8H3F2Y3_9LECA|nr:MAG: hypothetical protein HETSPECPRED_002749 [Heterodermia speciosa]